MENIKTYGSLLLAMLATFILGSYTTLVKYNVEQVEPHRWFMTIMVGIYFIIVFIERIRKK
jgi:FtsH-binding integral membrane protein